MLRTPPNPFDPARAARIHEFLAEQGFHATGPLLDAVFGNSPFLGRLSVREHGALTEYLAAGPLTVLNAAIQLAHAAARAQSEAEAMTQLRVARRRAALATAMADIGGLWDVNRVTGELTRFADACVGSALRFMLRQAATNQPAAAQSEVTEDDCGLTILAMGKYGAHELNYSSDIDLIVFYDAAKFPFAKGGDMRGAAADIVRGLVRLLAETTSDGYVFRVDLRLRPDAGATQIAISTDAALDYYEAMGQNWERAAMIKARPCAGDPQTGAQFMKAITPFIWRRHLDFAAIEDIHSIKRQIHAHAGHGDVKVAGHNIKLGRGGIREIEFFAQTQQLILGGRHPTLRVSSTQGALAALAAEGRVAPETAQDLVRDYRYLRMLEHRLQMVEDQQTHSLPSTPEGLAHIACFMGYENAEEFRRALTATLENVQGHYARLFESAPELSDTRGSLVFTGVEEDPETLTTLTRMGFERASDVSAIIRGWHHGRIRATRSARARELLTRLMPALLEALARTADPLSAFTHFDRFLSGLPAGVQVFSMLFANPLLLDLIAEIAGSAPKLADYLGRHAAVLDALIDPGFLTAIPSEAELRTRFAAELARVPGYEGALDGARRFMKEETFRIGVQIIQGVGDAEHAGPAYAAVAETVIAGLQAVVEGEMAAAHGRVAGGGFVVLALGKLGGREMTAASDLDLVFVYEHDPGAAQSDGTRPLSPPAYFARAAQRFIAALTALTAEGPLYEVDMRLRPSGNQGPVAVRLDSFAAYHRERSWTWERMALTRARVLSGPPALRSAVEAAIRDSLTRPADDASLLADARSMREKLAAQFPGRDIWDIKFAPGGLVDIEFVAQILQLRHAPSNRGVLDQNTIAAVEKLMRAGALDAADGQGLIAAARLEHGLTQVLRIALEGAFKAETATRGLKALLARAGDAPDFSALEAGLAEAEIRVRTIFSHVMQK